MQDIIAVTRNNKWLEQLLHQIWVQNFADIPEKNPVTIKFGRRARQTLGSIRYDKKNGESRILINRLFQDPRVPREVVQAVIAHEFVHYIHGFASTFPKKARYPHRSSLVTNEMKARGLSHVLDAQKRWIKRVWPKLIQEKLPRRPRKRIVRYRKVTLRRLLSSILS